MIASFVLGVVLGTGPTLPLGPTSKPELIALSAPSGRARIVHVWASWCRPCIAEWPVLAHALAELARLDVEVVTVALERKATVSRAGSILQAAPAFAGRSLWAESSPAAGAIDTFDPRWNGSVPTTYLFGPDGKIVLAQRGRTRIDELIRETRRIVRDASPSQH